jgi:hypothetical protein
MEGEIKRERDRRDRARQRETQREKTRIFFR